MTTVVTTQKPLRKRSGTAAWHMSRQAVSLSMLDVMGWTPEKCLDYLIEIRFGSRKTVGCPHCGTIGKHYWRVREQRWKCEGCGSPFSITSKTVFAGHRKTYREILASMLMWVNSAGGQPALELKRHLNVSYNTAFTLQHKMREALVRGYNVGILNGDVEMDGAHQSGRRAAEKRGKPKATTKSQDEDKTTVAENTAIMLEAQEKTENKKSEKTGAIIDPEYGKTLPKDRRILIALRKRSGVRGKGACASRVAIGLVEDETVVSAVAQTFIAAPESRLHTDSSPAYDKLGKSFAAHKTVVHSVELSGPHGENNNQAEELNGRYDRAEKGIYLNIEPKYMLDYAVEVSFRSDTRRLPNGDQLKIAMNLALSVGTSLYWHRFTKGHHRTDELLHPLPRPAAASGPKKGMSPLSNANGRLPR